MTPQATILASLVISAGVLTWRGAQEGTLSPRTYAALAVVAFMLLALGAFLPGLAAAFAVLVAVTVLLSGAESLQTLTLLGARREEAK